MRIYFGFNNTQVVIPVNENRLLFIFATSVSKKAR